MSRAELRIVNGHNCRTAIYKDILFLAPVIMLDIFERSSDVVFDVVASGYPHV